MFIFGRVNTIPLPRKSTSPPFVSMFDSANITNRLLTEKFSTYFVIILVYDPRHLLGNVKTGSQLLKVLKYVSYPDWG